MVGHGIQIAGDGKNVQSLNKGIVQNEHDGREPPGPIFVPKEHLANIANIQDFWVAKAEFPVGR